MSGALFISIVFVTSCGSSWSFRHSLDKVVKATLDSYHTVSDNHTVSDKHPALERVSFKNRIRACVGTSPWTGIRATAETEIDLADDFALQVKERIDNPRLIDQWERLFCGPTAFLYALAVSDPEAYEAMAEDLFCRGIHRHALSKVVVDATDSPIAQRYLKHPKLMEEEVATSSSLDGDGLLAPADFVMESALVQHNNVLHAPTEQNKFFQLTFPGAMQNWMPMLDAETKSYGSSVPVSIFHISESDWNIVRSRVATAAGQALAVLLMGWGNIGFPNHWVVLSWVEAEGEHFYRANCGLKSWGHYVIEPCNEVQKKVYQAILIDFEKGKAGGLPEHRRQQIVEMIHNDIHSSNTTRWNTSWNSPSEPRQEESRQ